MLLLEASGEESTFLNFLAFRHTCIFWLSTPFQQWHLSDLCSHPHISWCPRTRSPVMTPGLLRPSRTSSPPHIYKGSSAMWGLGDEDTDILEGASILPPPVSHNSKTWSSEVYLVLTPKSRTVFIKREDPEFLSQPPMVIPLLSMGHTPNLAHPERRAPTKAVKVVGDADRDDGKQGVLCRVCPCNLGSLCSVLPDNRATSLGWEEISTCSFWRRGRGAGKWAELRWAN